MARRIMAVLGGLAMAGALAACGPGTDAAQPNRTVPPGSVPTTVAPTTTVPITYTCTPDPDPITVAAGKPTVEVPTGDAPTELVTNDITVGDGPVAEVGDKVKMQYVGVLYSDGTQFDASWDNGGDPYEVTLGPEAQVIQGWNQGIPGMALGGRRQLVIPPDLAYGAQGSPPKIPADAPLVFVVDLVQVCKPDAAAAGTTVPGATTESTVATDSTTTTAAAAGTTSTTAAP